MNMMAPPMMDAERTMQFLFALRSKGVTDKRVLEAMEKVDRGLFVRGHFAGRAYEDLPLPIACGQTISHTKKSVTLQRLTRFHSHSNQGVSCESGAHFE